MTTPPRLPKLVEADPRADALKARLEQTARPVCTNSDIRVPTIPMTSGLASVLKSVQRARRIVRGIDPAEAKLKAEEKGLRQADRKSDVPRGVRVSRLLLLSNDGSDGFYRRVEKILKRYGDRVLAIKLDVDAVALARPLFGPDKATKLLLVEHKEAVAAILLKMAETSD